MQAQPSRYLPREFITVQQNMQALLASGLIASGKGQVQVRTCTFPASKSSPQFECTSGILV